MRWFVALILLTGAAFAQSQQPSPSAGVKISKDQTPAKSDAQKAPEDQRGTEKSPLIVKMQNAVKTQREAEQEPDYQYRKAADNRVANLTIIGIVVGVFQTVALFITFLVIAYVGIRQLRAYVYPSIKGLKKFSLTEPVEIAVSLRNAGQTPAKDCECSSVAFVGALPLADDVKMTDPAEPTDLRRHSRPAIYPQQESAFDAASIDILVPAIVQGLRERKAAIYVAGEAKYKDMFGFKRRSEFCFYIDPAHAILLIDAEQGKRVELPAEINFVTSHVWNRVT